MNRILKYALPLFLIFLVVGSSTANVINYSEVNETVEQNTIIDNGPINESYVNTHNETHDEVTVLNETIENITYEEHEQVLVGNETVYSHDGPNYKGYEINRVVLANGVVIAYGPLRNLVCCDPSPINKYVNATLYLRNGSAIDIVILNEGIHAYHRYALRQTVPVYEDNVTVYTNITNRITTIINHITEVIYEYVEPQPQPDPVDPVDPVEPVNNTTDVDPVIDDNTTEDNNESINTGIPMETTGNGIALGFAAVLAILVGLVLVARRD